jgi:hypothetical protein
VVKDASGGVVPSATVTVTNLDTAATRTVTGRIESRHWSRVVTQ